MVAAPFILPRRSQDVQPSKWAILLPLEDVVRRMRGARTKAQTWALTGASMDPADHLSRDAVLAAALAVAAELDRRHIPHLMALYNSRKRGLHVHLITPPRDIYVVS